MSGKFVGKLAHHTVYFNKALCAKAIPFISSLHKHHVGGHFTLVHNPNQCKRTCIIGMFVLRPARGCFRSNLQLSNSSIVEKVYEECDWVYNIRGIDGGRPISDSSPVDGLRLALQYGLSDAVLFGSKVATTDGAVSASSRGYIWQPYEVCSFGHVYAADPNLAEAIAKQRREWQKLDLLSKRDFPAQILVTWTGEKKHAQHDFLASRIFHEKLPTGLPMEAYIVTSERGAWNIRQRAADFSLQNRIEDMLIVLPPSAFSPSGDDLHVSSNNTTTATDFETDGLSVDMDLSLLPTYLYEHLDIRVANHDGGRDVLRAFARAGALSQLNLTLCQDRSAVEVLRGNSSYVVESGVHPSEYEDPALESKLQYFFDSANLISSGSNSSTRSSDTISNSSGVSSTEGDVLDVHEANTTTKRGVPRHLEVVEVAQGVVDPVMIVTLKAKTDMFDF